MLIQELNQKKERKYCDIGEKMGENGLDNKIKGLSLQHGSTCMLWYESRVDPTCDFLKKCDGCTGLRNSCGIYTPISSLLSEFASDIIDRYNQAKPKKDTTYRSNVLVVSEEKLQRDGYSPRP